MRRTFQKSQSLFIKLMSIISILSISHASSPQSFFDENQGIPNYISEVQTILDPLQMKTSILNAIQKAKQQIIICSPFLSNNSMHTSGLDQLLSKKIAEGVRVGVATCSNLTSTKQYETKAIEILQKMGACVKFYEHIHAKFIVIDDTESLIGSFNFLSGSFDPKYRYYQLNLLQIVKGDLSKEVIRHVMPILKNEPAPKASLSSSFNIYSQSQEMGSLYAKLIKDAKTSLVICSPNLSDNFLRVSGILDSLSKKILSGVSVTIYTDSEMDNAKSDATNARLQLGLIGTRLILKKGIHLKFIIQDDAVLYTGSDNILAGSTHNGGGGFWRELGMLINFKSFEIESIKSALDKIPTIMDILDSRQETPKAPRTPDLKPSIFPEHLPPMHMGPAAAASSKPPVALQKLPEITPYVPEYPSPEADIHDVYPPELKSTVKAQPIAVVTPFIPGNVKKTIIKASEFPMEPSEDAQKIMELNEQKKRARQDIVSLSSLSSSSSSPDIDSSSTSDSSSDSASTTSESNSSVSSTSSSDSDIVLTQCKHKKSHKKMKKQRTFLHRKILKTESSRFHSYKNHCSLLRDEQDAADSDYSNGKYRKRF